MKKGEKIVLGSGYLYVTKFTGTVPDVKTICVEDNRLAYIQGGASVEYTPTFYEAKDDLGYATKTLLTDESVVMKSGIMTWYGETLAKLCSTARVTTDETTRTVKIGGLGNYNDDKYVICFHHPDKTDGDMWLLIVGQNQSGFSLAFAKDKETVIDAEFKAAASIDAEGTLIQYVEEIKSDAKNRATQAAKGTKAVEN